LEQVCNRARLFFEEKGRGNRTFLCIHNTGGDHRLFAPQLDFFSSHGRVVALDLRGHGKSDKPKKRYSFEVFHKDLIALCKKLSLENVVAIGSSTGGNIALDLACRHPKLVKAAVMIDSAIFYSPQIRQKIQKYRDRSRKEEDLSETIEKMLGESCLSTDWCKEQMRETYKAVPSYVWQGCFASMLKWDMTSKKRVAGCKTPILYIEASAPSSDRSQLASLREFSRHLPGLATGKVVGSGHYPSLEVPDQINAMILQFLRVKGLLS